MKLNSIPELIEDIRAGKMVILMDDEDRENEGDLVMAASHVRTEDINFMATHARGLICLTLTEDRCRQLDLPLMVRGANGAAYGTNFTMSIEAAEGVTTGISAADRAKTVQVAVAKNAKPEDIVQPGHIFPIMAQPSGVLNRAGHTEAGCDLARLAGQEPSAVIVEIMNEDGTMARRPDLETFAEKHDLKIGTIADLIQYRITHEKTVERVLEHDISTDSGDFKAVVYRDSDGNDAHIALVKGQIDAEQAVPVRVQTLDTLRDVVNALRNGKVGWSFKKALDFIADQENGIALLLGHQLTADEMIGQFQNYFTGEERSATAAPEANSAVYRTIGTGSQILKDLGVHKMQLLNSPMRFNAISGFDLEIVEYIAASE